MFTKVFWQRTIERAIKSAATAASGIVTADAIKPDLLTLDWQALIGGSGAAALLSILLSIGSSSVGDPESPSLVS